MILKPKFQTGETIEENSGRICIVMGRTDIILNYFYPNIFSDNYEYILYDVSSGIFRWRMEECMIPICQNTERGKRILRKKLKVVATMFGVNFNKMKETHDFSLLKKFYKDWLSKTEEL